MAGREVVIWSGGLDSTLVLHKLATNSTEVWPVVALTVEHHQVDKHQLTAQYAVQQKYLAFAKSKGYHVEHVRIDTRSNSNSRSEVGQAILWFSTILPYLQDGDRVHLGYIRDDTFWHYKGAFLAALEAVGRFGEFKVEPVFDLEWATKIEVVRELRKFKIKPEHVWTCESPVSTKKAIYECGACSKCKSLLAACAELEKYPEKTVVAKEDLRKKQREKFKPAVFRW